MTPAPDTGRTADELQDALRGMRRERDSWKELAAENAIAADRYAREAAQLRSRLLEAEQGGEATRWRRTGTSSHPVGGGRGESQWFRQSDGSLRMFPDGFDPNSGTYGSVIVQGENTIYLCPGDTFVPAPDPLSPETQEAGDHEPR